MDSAQFRTRLLPSAIALITQATGEANPLVMAALLETCEQLEASAHTPMPIVSLERDVRLDQITYHLNVRRLNSSSPPGKFQVLITQELASGLLF